MQQEAALDLAFFEIVHELLVFFGTECGRDERLRFTAGEQRRTVDSRQPADFASNRSNLREPASVRTATLVENIVAEDAFPSDGRKSSSPSVAAPADLRDTLRRLLSSVHQRRHSLRVFPELVVSRAARKRSL